VVKNNTLFEFRNKDQLFASAWFTFVSGVRKQVRIRL